MKFDFDDAILEKAATNICVKRGGLPENFHFFMKDAIAALEAIFDWQPIETAPRDAVLFGNRNRAAILVTDGRALQAVQWSNHFDYWTVANEGSGLYFEPTHYLATDIPLPEVK